MDGKEEVAIPGQAFAEFVERRFDQTSSENLDKADGLGKVPNADQAVIAQDKLCHYLLNIDHERGGSKARLLVAMGYSLDQWQRLEADLRAQHLIVDVDRIVDSDYGPRYEIVAALVGPAGRSVVFRSVWQIDTGSVVPRLITMYPG